MEKEKNKEVKSKRKKRAKRPIRKKIIKLSSGLIRGLGDFILLWVGFAEEISPLGSAGSMSMIKRLDLRLGGYNSDALYDVFYRLRSKDWLDPDWELTKEGWKRLKSVLPEYKKPSEWDGKWYIITFDIPEAYRIKRNAFREKLKKLGFGRLQNSVWISPLNCIANVESLVKFRKMEYWVIPSVTDKLGRETSEELAERVWPIERVNERYKNFISRCRMLFRKEKGHKISKFGLLTEYLNILKEDPQLPEDLLPGDWKGVKAHKFYQKIFRQSKKEQSKKEKHKEGKERKTT